MRLQLTTWPATGAEERQSKQRTLQRQGGGGQRRSAYRLHTAARDIPGCLRPVARGACRGTVMSRLA